MITVVVLGLSCSPGPADDPVAPPSPETGPGTDADAGADPEEAEGADDPEEPLPEDEAAPEPIGSAGNGPRVSDGYPRWGGGVARLADVRLIAHPSLDRLVLEFDGALPSWRVQPTTGPLVEVPGRTEVELAGDSVLEVRLVPATSIDRDAAEPMSAYEGPGHVPSVGGVVEEAVLTTDASDILVWGIGVTGAPSFSVGTLEGPDRLVIDVLHGTGPP